MKEIKLYKLTDEECEDLGESIYCEEVDENIDQCNIKCLNCKKKTTPMFTLDVASDNYNTVDYPTTYSFSCENCYFVTTICGYCYNEKQINNVCTLKQTFYSVDGNNALPPDSKNYDKVIDYRNGDNAYILLWKAPIYSYDAKKYGDITGPCGGEHPHFHCNKCKKDWIAYDK
jgi:hypothetical protein